MAQRFTCLICRNEIAHPGAECPHCRGRSVIAEGASPRILVVVFGAMVALFVLTGLFARSFRSEGRSRGAQHFESAEQMMAQGRYEDAISHYRDALLYSRDNALYRLGLARALFAHGNFTETETHLVELRMEDPASGVLNLLLARLAARDNRVGEAVSYYRTAIHGHWEPGEEDARLGVRMELVEVLENAGGELQMTAELAELADTAPDDVAVRARVAALLLKRGLYDRASSLFESVLAMAPGNRNARLGRAEAEFRLGNYGAAKTHFAAAQALAEDEETAARIDLCRRVIELDPTRRGIGSGGRYARSRVLIERAIAALSHCRGTGDPGFVGPVASLPSDSAATVERAARALRKESLEALDEAFEVNILLAEEVWSVAKPLCGERPPRDEPLRLVLRKLSQ